jgi:hypothetical protein
VALRWARFPEYRPGAVRVPGESGTVEVMQVRLSGELEVVAAGVPVRGAKQRALLAVQRGQPVSADRLIDLLWGDGRQSPLSLFTAFEQSLSAAKTAILAANTRAAKVCVISSAVTLVSCYPGVGLRPARSSLSAQSRAAAWVSLARALGSAGLQLTK